jgi:glycerol-3-phosphate dehydrogenase (NAD(P)+)
MRCTVVGAGAWGTALADLSRPQRARSESLGVRARRGRVDQFEAREPAIPSRARSLSPFVKALGDVERAVEGAELVTLATPSQVLQGSIKSRPAHYQ